MSRRTLLRNQLSGNVVIAKGGANLSARGLSLQDSALVEANYVDAINPLTPVLLPIGYSKYRIAINNIAPGSIPATAKFYFEMEGSGSTEALLPFIKPFELQNQIVDRFMFAVCEYDNINLGGFGEFGLLVTNFTGGEPAGAYSIRLLCILV